MINQSDMEGLLSQIETIRESGSAEQLAQPREPPLGDLFGKRRGPLANH